MLHCTTPVPLKSPPYWDRQNNPKYYLLFSPLKHVLVKQVNFSFNIPARTEHFQQHIV